ncbi:hypothetical protein DMI70_15850 [Escherichia coli]|nr:hypothetical protein [Escherichia coli]
MRCVTMVARPRSVSWRSGKAKELTNEASALLSDDSTEWAKFAKPKKTNVNDDQYIVINASVGISESWCSDTRKRSRDKNCQRKKMAKGIKKGAMEELRPAGVGVMENQYLMPLKQTRNALADAQKLLDKKQYYEANRRLKVRKMESSLIAKHCL